MFGRVRMTRASIRNHVDRTIALVPGLTRARISSDDGDLETRRRTHSRAPSNSIGNLETLIPFNGIMDVTFSISRRLRKVLRKIGFTFSRLTELGRRLW